MTAKSLCIASITHFTEQAETIQGIGKAGGIEECAGGDRRRQEVTVGAQVMTDETRKDRGYVQGIIGAERGTGEMYRR